MVATLVSSRYSTQTNRSKRFEILRTSSNREQKSPRDMCHLISDARGCSKRVPTVTSRYSFTQLAPSLRIRYPVSTQNPNKTVIVFFFVDTKTKTSFEKVLPNRGWTLAICYAVLDSLHSPPTDGNKTESALTKSSFEGLRTTTGPALPADPTTPLSLPASAL